MKYSPGHIAYYCALYLFVIFFTSSYCFAQSVSSAELINNAKLYDGKVVVFAGEAVGDVMARGKFAWVNINDGNNAIGIWIDGSLAKDIIYTGSYKSKGDWLEVSGIFNRACLQHGGDLDIHAQAMRKINNGRVLTERLNSAKRNLSLILLGVTCLVLTLRQLIRK